MIKKYLLLDEYGELYIAYNLSQDDYTMANEGTVTIINLLELTVYCPNEDNKWKTINEKTWS